MRFVTTLPREENRISSRRRGMKGLLVAEIPLRVVRVEVVLGQGRGAVADGVEHVLGVDAFAAGDGLGQQAECAVGELLDAPQLFGCSAEGVFFYD